MGFYIKKSKNFGPFKLNFSKSGLGLSFGKKGCRVALNNKGVQLNAGKNGVYYRKSVSLNKLAKGKNGEEIMEEPSQSGSSSAKFIFFMIDIAVLIFCFVMYNGENNVYLAVGLVALVFVPVFILSFIVDGFKALIKMFKG